MKNNYRRRLVYPLVYIALLLIVFLVIVKLNFAKIKGSVGERKVNVILQKLNSEEYTIFHDLYVPKEDGSTAQVDHIVTSKYGIFVIETKHYDGWIFGSENQKQWTQVIFKRKEKLFNPIWQNKGHIKALQNYLHMDQPHSFHSIIAFSPSSTFKFKEEFTSARVIQFHQLIREIKSVIDPVLSEVELQGLNRELEKLKIHDRKEKKIIKKQHVSKIKEKKNKSAVINIGNTCPKCGKELVLRKGKYGDFYGCSGYPKCRYTREDFRGRKRKA
ncbi:NERD domain-containing protein [Bacillaceae bacterium S4-13-58]